jgi:polyphosphate kinase
MRYSIGEIFRPFGYDTFKSYTIKFTRDAELDIDNDFSKSFIELMSESIKKRKKGAPVRFVYDKEIPELMLQQLFNKLQISEIDHLRGGGKYHNFKDFMSFPKVGAKRLNYEKQKPLNHPMLAPNKNILDIVNKQDIMLHYPYQSFQYIVDLLREAAIDPKVKAIKMTFYRAARNSNVINALINAARNGKMVTVFLEIQARFDEEANIYWGERLTEEGVKVIKTLPGFKVHAKLMLIRRKENNQNIYYTNISTGNFNESTAKIYADDALLTANQEIANEVNMLFHLFESPYNPPRFKHLLVAPYYLRNHLVKLLNTEIRNAKAGKKAWAILKLNNIVDEKIADKLYQAAAAGVKLNIICRGICIVKPDLPSLQGNMKIISIIDKFLEHSRHFVFANGGHPKFYFGSADWMVRNLDHRFEVICPIYDDRLKAEVMDMLKIQLADNVKARLLDSERINQYKTNNSSEKVRSQFALYDYFKDKLIKN